MYVQFVRSKILLPWKQADICTDEMNVLDTVICHFLRTTQQSIQQAGIFNSMFISVCIQKTPQTFTNSHSAVATITYRPLKSTRLSPDIFNAHTSDGRTNRIQPVKQHLKCALCLSNSAYNREHSSRTQTYFQP